MPKIEQANSVPKFYVGVSDKHHITKRIRFPAGLTHEECLQRMKHVLKDVDDKEDKEIEKEIYMYSDEYPLKHMQKHKHRELERLKVQIQEMNNNNNSRFAGGYTGPAIMDHKAEVDRIKKYEESRKAEIDKKFDGSRESLEYVRNLERAEEKQLEENRRRNELYSNNSSISMIPRVGGSRAHHAVAHGGGFNHRGVYAGGVWN